MNETLMMKKPTLYIMCGLPFAGKSVLAEKLATHFGWKVVAIDELKAKRGLRDVWQQMKAEDWEDIFAEASRLAATELKSGRSVVYDSTNHTKASRDQLRKVAESCACPAKVIFVDVPAETATSRWRANETTGERMKLPSWAFNAALRDWEPPAVDEQPITYSQGADFSRWTKNLERSNPKG